MTYKQTVWEHVKKHLDSPDQIKEVEKLISQGFDIDEIIEKLGLEARDNKLPKEIENLPEKTIEELLLSGDAEEQAKQILI